MASPAPKPAKPPRPNAPTNRAGAKVTGVKVLPMSGVSPISEPIYEEIEVQNTSKDTHPSLRNIKSDIVSRRTGMFESGETPYNKRSILLPGLQDVSNQNGVKPKPPPTETIPSMAGRQGKSQPSKPPLPHKGPGAKPPVASNKPKIEAATDNSKAPSLSGVAAESTSPSIVKKALQTGAENQSASAVGRKALQTVSENQAGSPVTVRRALRPATENQSCSPAGGRKALRPASELPTASPGAGRKALRPTSVAVKPSIISPKPKLSPTGAVYENAKALTAGGASPVATGSPETPETPTPTAESPGGASVSVQSLKDKFGNQDTGMYSHVAPPVNRPVVKLRPNLDVIPSENGPVRDGSGSPQGHRRMKSDSAAIPFYAKVKPKPNKVDIETRKRAKSTPPEEEEIYTKPSVPVKNFNVGELQKEMGSQSPEKKRVQQAYDGVIILSGEDGVSQPQVQEAPSTEKPTVSSRGPQAYDGVIILGGEDGDGRPQVQETTPTHKPPIIPKHTPGMPPKKPPRTFEHDDYIKAKIEKKQKHISSPAKMGRDIGVLNSPIGGDYNKHESLRNVKSEGSLQNRKWSEDSSQMKGGDTTSQNSLVELRGASGRSRARSGESSRPQTITEDDEIGGLGYAVVGEAVKADVDSSKRGSPRPPRPPLPSVGDDDDPRWDKPVVRVTKHNKALDKDHFVAKKRNIRNPGYEEQHEFLPIKKFDGELKRVKSEECIYSEPEVRSVVMDKARGQIVNRVDSTYDEIRDPIYHDPVDVVQTSPLGPHVSAHGVTVDEEGYALPEMRHKTGGLYGRQQSTPDKQGGRLQRAGTMTVADNRLSRSIDRIQLQRKRSSVRDKISRAYSVLRPRKPAPEAATEGCMQTMVEEDDSDTEMDMEEQRRRVQYVASVRDRTNHCIARYGRVTRQDKIPLFQLALLVGLEKNDDSNTYKPVLLAQYPAKVEDDQKVILDFCFPDASVWRPVTNYTRKKSKCEGETYSFVLTDTDGSRKHGYCRRVLPPGSGNRLPEVYCLISPVAAWNFYGNFLKEVEKRRNVSLEHAKDMLRAAFSKSLPRPGQEAWLWCQGANIGKESVILKRSSNPRLDNVSFTPLLTKLSTDVLLKVFASILLERRIIFTALHLSTLTACSHAVTALLYPFVWQHTFVPVLPGQLLEFVGAPTPYIMGVLTAQQPKLQELCLEEILLVDLDNSSLLVSQGDEGRIIPKKLQKALTSAVKSEADCENTQDMVVSEAFLRLFVETCGHYTEYICTQQDGKKVFERESFIKAVTSKSIRMFLEWFSETQMFEVFVREKTDLPNTQGLFETRVLEYREEMEEMGLSFKQIVKQGGRKMLNFFLESGDKIKKKLTNETVFV